MAEVKNWLLKVKEQKKLDSGNVSMNCILNGTKDKDGNYPTCMWIRVILTEETEWKERCDETGNYIEVDGKFSHSDWKKDGKSGKNFTIFASSVRKHVFEEKNSGGGSNY